MTAVGKMPASSETRQVQFGNLGELGASLVAQTVKNPPAPEKTQVRSLGGEDPLEKEKAAHSSILAWRNPMDREAWGFTGHGVAKSWTRLNDFH